MKNFRCPLAVFALIAAFSANADSLLVFQGTGVAPHEIAIAGGKMAMSQGGHDVIFDSQRQLMTVLQHEQKRYMVMDEASVKQMSTIASGLMQGMEAALAQMPPEQRAQMQAAMGKMGGQSGSLMPQLTMKDTGRSSKVGGRSCTVWQTLVNGRVETEQCLATRSSLNLPSEDSRTIDAFVAFGERMAASMGPFGAMAAQLKTMRDRFPLQITEFEGQRRIVRELSSQSEARLPATRFEVPAGYQQQNMGELLQNAAPKR